MQGPRRGITSVERRPAGGPLALTVVGALSALPLARPHTRGQRVQQSSRPLPSCPRPGPSS